MLQLYHTVSTQKVARNFLAGDFLAHAVTFGNFMAGDFLTRIRTIHVYKHDHLFIIYFYV